MSQSNHKLDIFQVLNRIDKKHHSFYSKLSDEEQKAFQPLVVMKWLGGVQQARQIMFLNELVNPFVFSLARHKDLLFKLMTICTTGNPSKYQWNKTLSKKIGKMPLSTNIVKGYFKYTPTRAREALPLLSNEDIISFAEQLGMQKEEISKVKLELKQRINE